MTTKIDRKGALAALDNELRARGTTLEAGIEQARKMGVKGDRARLEDLALAAGGYPVAASPVATASTTPPASAGRAAALRELDATLRRFNGSDMAGAVATARKMGVAGTDVEIEDTLLRQMGITITAGAR